MVALSAAVAVALVLPALAGAAVPIATTGTATDITTTDATLHGTVDPQGQDTQYTFFYTQQGAGGNPTEDPQPAPVPAGTVSAVAGPSAVSVTVTGLGPGTIYHVTLKASNGSGNASGSDVTFATRPVAPQMQTPLEAHEITDTSALLFNWVSLDGVPVAYHYEYGTTTSYGSTSPAPEAESDPVPGCDVSTVAPPVNVTVGPPCWSADQAVAITTLTGLTPGTTYHYRLVAHSVAGQTVSPDATFTTTGTAPAPAASPPPSSRTAKPARLRILTGSASVSRRGTTTLLVACSTGTSRCHDTLALVVVRRDAEHRRRTLTLARAHVNLRAGAVAHITLTLDRAGLRLLAHASHRRLRVRATAGTVRHTVTLT